MLAGNQAAALNPAVGSVLASSYFLASVEVTAATSTLGIVALGDSITDGAESTENANLPLAEPALPTAASAKEIVRRRRGDRRGHRLATSC